MTKEKAIQIIQEEAIYMAIEALKNSGGWISVKEMLPETEGSTLICTAKGAVCTASLPKVWALEWMGRDKRQVLDAASRTAEGGLNRADGT